MSQLTEIHKFKLPLGGQEVELQEIVHGEGAMPMLRIRIREAKRFTIFDVDPLTTRQWSEVMLEWAKTQEAKAK